MWSSPSEMMHCLRASTVGKQLLGLLTSTHPGACTLSTVDTLVTMARRTQVSGQILEVMKLVALLP